MRFFTTTIFGLLALTLFAPSTVQACERECQVNVSHAFADKYKVISNQYFTILNQNVGESLYYGIPQKTLTTAEATAALKTLQDSVAAAQAAWEQPLFKTVFDTIFLDEPKFKGDCNHPWRVRQPPRGVNWVMADCHNMDYICGNPPSICHFMPMIKTRIVKKLKELFQSRVDGDESDVYTNYVGVALQQAVMNQPKLAPHTATLHGNLNQIMENLKDSLEKFGETQWKPEWDMEIKELLLTFP
ncbi:hypothetical protein BGW38_002235 [Lunasporangiospora selenospora]|uniref:Uncharacterized protein n=1 Tax=Lunasporangiospora selenospora TaxID=979761 RepID=A0A9P6G0Y9_9FUNG|nr:hypothetical protein BGW38_002235 [Lunasporangiospora selenospora]